MELLPHFRVSSGCWEVAPPQSAGLIDLIPIRLNLAISEVLAPTQPGLDLQVSAQAGPGRPGPVLTGNMGYRLSSAIPRSFLSREFE